MPTRPHVSLQTPRSSASSGWACPTSVGMLLPQWAHTVRSAGLASARNCDPFCAIAIRPPTDAGGGLKDQCRAPRREVRAAPLLEGQLSEGGGVPDHVARSVSRRFAVPSDQLG